MLFENLASSSPNKHTTMPTQVGGTVMGCVFDGGVLICADTTLTNSTTKRLASVRVHAIDDVLFTMSGDASDSQELLRRIKNLKDQSKYNWTTEVFGAPIVSSTISMQMYDKKTNCDPYWGTVLIAGRESKSTTKNLLGRSYMGTNESGKFTAKQCETDLSQFFETVNLPVKTITNESIPVLYRIDIYGTTISENYVASGLGMHIAIPHLRKHWKPNLDFSQAKNLLSQAFAISACRDTRAGSLIQFAVCLTDGSSEVLSPEHIVQNWDVKAWTAPTLETKVVTKA